MELWIVIAMLVALVLAVYFFSGKQTRVPPIRPVKIGPDSARVPSAGTPEAPADAGAESLQNPLDSVKAQIRTGIQTLFSRQVQEEGSVAAEPPICLDVEPQVMDKVTKTIESIHNFRSVHQRLQKILSDPALNVVSALSTVIIADPVLSSKVLKIVNSAYFGRSQKVNSIGHALFLLGMVHLREILYREGMLDLLKVNDPEKNSLIDVFWRHATITSICASHLRGLFPGLEQGTLFTSGLIHDVGKIILARMSDDSEYTTQSTIEDEERIFGINHVVAGRLALEAWGFSELMISVVSNHHGPAHVPLPSLKLSQEASQYLMALFLANQLAKMMQPGQNYLPVEPLHPSYHALLNQDAFARAALDGVLMNQIAKSEAFVTT